MLTSPLRTELRRLRRRPLLATTVILTAAISIAATTTLATVLRHFVLRPLPGVGAPSELVNLHRADAHDAFGGFSLDEYRALAGRLAGLEGVAAFRDQGVSLADGDEPSLAVAQVVSGNYFTTLRARPAAGRLLAAGDDRAGAPPVVVLDHALWQRRFGGDPAVVGRAVRLNGHPFEVVGVAPPGFVGTFLGFRFELYVPLAQLALADPGFARDRPEQHRLELVARRRAGVTPAAAREELALLAEAFRRDSPDRWRDAAFGLAATTGVEPSLEAAAKLFFTALGAFGALALAVVATNVAGLLLADLLARRHELSVRAALGGSRRRLLAPLVLQSTLLFGAGGALGVALALVASRGLGAWSARLSIPLDLELRPDPAVLFFGLALALALGAIVGAAAAWRVAQVPAAEALAGARGTAGQRSRRPRALLVTAQVLGSVVLLALALRFAADARAARGAELGLRLAGVALVDFHVGLLGLETDEQSRLLERTLARLTAVPEVEAVAAAAPFPLAFGQPTRPVGRTASPDEAEATAVAVVSPGYFELLDLPLVAGRLFTASDGAAAPPVAIVNESFAAQWGETDSPLDRVVYVGGAPTRVVGIARDSRSRRPWQAARPLLYLSMAQSPTPRATLAVRHRGELAALAPLLRQALRETAPDLGAPPPRPAVAQLAALVAPQRAAATIAAALGGLALLLSALGLYALLARQVTAGHREIGIRQALGATAAAIRRHYLGRALHWTAAGVVAGLPLVLAADRLLRPLLPASAGVAGTEYLIAAALLTVIAAAASWFPAQLAARIPAASALRQD